MYVCTFSPFRNHEHGALNIFNSEIITLKNCKFHNNTSDSRFTTKLYQGSAGGCSIGYNSPNNNFTKAPFQDSSAYYAVFAVPPILQDYAHVLITNCIFTNNSAVLPTGYNGTSTDALTHYMFHGRGGALAILINIDIPLIFEFSDNIVMNNFAGAFGGGVYCITQRRSNQTYRFGNSVFANNRAPKAGGLGLVYLLNASNTLSKFAVQNYVYDCTFYNNKASEIAGAVIVSAVYGLAANIFVAFKNCRFFNNTATTYGGAVDITSYNFFDHIESQSLVDFNNR